MLLDITALNLLLLCLVNIIYTLPNSVAGHGIDLLIYTINIQLFISISSEVRRLYALKYPSADW